MMTKQETEDLKELVELAQFKSASGMQLETVVVPLPIFLELIARYEDFEAIKGYLYRGKFIPSI